MAGRKFDMSIILRLRDGATSGFKKLATGMKVAGAAAAAFTALSIKTTISYQKEMNMAGAVTSATADEMIKMKEVSKELGASTQFSAVQAASAMSFMGKAGMSVNEILGASPKVLQLAGAAQLDMGSAANIVTNIMAGWRMEVGELDRANDVLVNAFTGSNTDLTQLGEGMRNAGATAKAMGFTFEETAASIGLLGSLGTPGAEGGIAMKTMMVRMTQMQNPTKKQANVLKKLGAYSKATSGELKSVSDWLKVFEDAMADGATEQKANMAAMELFNLRAGPKFIGMLGLGSKELDKFTESLKKEGTTAEINKRQMDGLPGAWFELSSAFAAVQLELGESPIGDAIERGMRKAAESLRNFSAILPELIKDTMELPGKLDKLWDGFFDGIAAGWGDFVAEWNAEWRRVWDAIPKPIRDWLTGDKVTPSDVNAPAADVAESGGLGQAASEYTRLMLPKGDKGAPAHSGEIDFLGQALSQYVGTMLPKGDKGVGDGKAWKMTTSDVWKTDGLQVPAQRVEVMVNVASKDGSTADVRGKDGKGAKLNINNTTTGQNYMQMGWSYGQGG